LRGGALIILAAALVACDVSPSPAPSPAPSAPTQAADLRTQLDLLLTEHVVIVAKESAAAINHSAEYAGYTALLATNETALSRVLRGAFGSTAAATFSQAWITQNEYLVDYAIGVATHDTDKSKAAIGRLNQLSTPRLADVLAGLTFGQAGEFSTLLASELSSIREVIDGAAAHHYAAMYLSLTSGISTAVTLGDALGGKIAQQFPDKYPGDQTAPEVVRRVRLNVLMQERAYLVTMATESQVTSRNDEKAQALGALATNLDLIVSQLDNARTRQVWVDEMSSLQRYAVAGDAAAKNALTEAFVSRLASTSSVSPGVLSNQVNATIKVIDDQRTKKFDDVADDDRAAATSMQPVADSL